MTIPSNASTSGGSSTYGFASWPTLGLDANGVYIGTVNYSAGDGSSDDSTLGQHYVSSTDGTIRIGYGIGPYLSLKLAAECGDDLSAWPSAKHFTSWLGLAPSNKISGGKVLSSRTRRCGNRASALLRLAAVTVGRTDTALGAFYRRLSARIGKTKAITATARKIAVLFYNALRHGMEYVDPGASFYETRYRARVVDNLHRRAKAFGFVLQPIEPTPSSVVS